jgi:hypothetical protein
MQGLRSVGEYAAFFDGAPEFNFTSGNKQNDGGNDKKAYREQYAEFISKHLGPRWVYREMMDSPLLGSATGEDRLSAMLNLDFELTVDYLTRKMIK